MKDHFSNIGNAMMSAAREYALDNPDMDSSMILSVTVHVLLGLMKLIIKEEYHDHVRIFDTDMQKAIEKFNEATRGDIQNET
jgi:hypothetical protein